MLKKIIAIFSIVFILLTSILSITVSAVEEPPEIDLNSFTREESNYTILPMGDGEINYYLFINDDSYNNIIHGATNYPIRGYLSSANIIVSVPDDVKNGGGVFSHYIRGYSTNGINENRQVAMYDGTQLYLQTFGENLDQHRLSIVQFNIQGNAVGVYNIGSSFTDGQDIALYMASDGTIAYWIYDLSTGNIISSNFINTISFYGFLFPSDYATSNEAYDQGFLDGTDVGYDVGYRDGVKSIDQDNIYNVGFNDGYELGIEEQYGDTDLYQLGYAHGQDTNNIVENAISGFFSSFGDFFAPFMSIGVGNLTIRTMLGFMCFAVIIIAILKIIRG